MILVGDCLEVMRTLEPNSVDSIVTDPPYHLTSASRRGHARTNNPTMPHGRHRIGDKGFMGKVWDGGDIAFRVETWAEALRVAKPGAYLAAFGGTRTSHRLACAIEDAGWELRDTLMWLYGSGFPKSKNPCTCKPPVRTEAIDAHGWRLCGSCGKQYELGTALKPAWEPIVLARKPLIGTVDANVLVHGTGALNIDGCRVEGEPVRIENYQSEGANGCMSHGHGGGNGHAGKERSARIETAGRWPANVVHDGSEEVLAAFPNAPGQQGDLTGEEPSGAREYANTYGKMDRRHAAIARTDSGSAARFFAQHQHSDDDWLWSTLSLVSAAGSTFCLQNESVASAVSRAATAVLPVGSRCVVSIAPSTSVTATELRLIATALIGTIQRTVSECWHGPRLEGHTPSASPARVAVAHEQTGITTITVSQWKSDGSAEPVTFNITETNSEPGAKDFGRFKYCAKASREDRNDGCEDLPKKTSGMVSNTSGQHITRRDGGAPAPNHHPTVKPTALMRWLCRLVTPPGGLVLDPFAGSGSTGRGALAEGMKFIGIELDPEYARIAEARIRAIQPALALGAT